MLLFANSGFTPSSKREHRIVVCVEQRDSDVVLEVSDNGGVLTPRTPTTRSNRSIAP